MLTFFFDSIKSYRLLFTFFFIIEIAYSLLFLWSVEYRLFFTFSLSISNPAKKHDNQPVAMSSPTKS